MHPWIEKYGEEIKAELVFSWQSQPATKDILVVVRDQLDYVSQCIESIQATTTNYTLYVWDNGSGPETQTYLQERAGITLVRKEENEGFIKPNNELAKLGCSDYIILLNSDIFCQTGWAEGLVGYLQHNPEVAEVGYLGGILDAELKGGASDLGSNIDYIPGWCLCISRQTYDEFGLFDDAHLEFAYFEDSDFSLRLQEAGKKIYALHLDLVQHFQNKTVKAVVKERDLRTSFENNHRYAKSRWGDYIKAKRITTYSEVAKMDK